MASDTTFLFFQRNSDDSHAALSPNSRSSRINYQRSRGASVPPPSALRSRAGSVPPLSTGVSGRTIHTVSSLANERAGLVANHPPSFNMSADYPRGVGRNNRRASISVPTELKQKTYPVTSLSFRAYTSTSSQRPTIYTTISDDRLQSRSLSRTDSSMVNPQNKPVTLGQYRIIPPGISNNRVPITSENSMSTARKVKNCKVIGMNEVKNDQALDNWRSKINISKDDIELPRQYESLSDLRARTKVARDKLSHHRVLLDRYLPINMGPTNDVDYEVENKYGELLLRMPQLDYKRTSTNEDSDFKNPVSLVAPYKPASRPTRINIPQIQVRNSLTPKISETRKRARSVLCKVKGDPHYFSF